MESAGAVADRLQVMLAGMVKNWIRQESSLYNLWLGTYFKLRLTKRYGTIRQWIGEVIAYFAHRTTQGR